MLKAQPTTINQRVDALVQEIDGGNRSAFARRVDLSPGAVAEIVGGRLSKPGFEVLQKIVLALPNLNRDWLLLGEGEMLTDNAPLGPSWASQKAPKHWPDQVGPAPEHYGYLGNYPILTTSENTVVPVVKAYNRSHYAQRNQSPASAEHAKYHEPYESLSLPASLLLPGRHMVFPVTDYSMEPTLMREDYILCSYVDSSEWKNISDATICAVISTTHSLLIKRISTELEEDTIRCFSDNRRHYSVKLKVNDIQEIWSFTWRLSSFSDDPYKKFDDRAQIRALQTEVSKLRRRIEPLPNLVLEQLREIIVGQLVTERNLGEVSLDIANDKQVLRHYERERGPVEDHHEYVDDIQATLPELVRSLASVVNAKIEENNKPHKDSMKSYVGNK